MPTFVEFWSDAHHGNAFGVKGIMYGPKGHRGDDTNGWPAGTPVPAIRAGRVVRSEKQTGLGNVVTVWDGTYYVAYCHLANRAAAVGDQVAFGQSVGGIGNTGLLSTGVHVHVTASRTGSNPADAAVVDPRPLIVSARTAAASGGTTPLEDQMTPEQAQQLKAIYDALFKTTTVSKSTTGYADIPGGTLTTLSHLYSRPAAGLTDAQIEAIASRVAQMLKVPTAAENGAAARAAIVK